MKKVLIGFFLFLGVTCARAEWIPLPHGFIGFGETDPFSGAGRVTVYDFNERIPKFEAWIVNLGDLFSEEDTQIKSFLIPIPETGVMFEPIDIEWVYAEDKELRANVGQIFFIDDLSEESFPYNQGLGKGFAFLNIDWQAEIVSSVPEPASTLLFLSGLVLMGMTFGKRGPLMTQRSLEVCPD